MTDERQAFLDTIQNTKSSVADVAALTAERDALRTVLRETREALKSAREMAMATYAEAEAAIKRDRQQEAALAEGGERG